MVNTNDFKAGINGQEAFLYVFDGTDKESSP